MADSRKRKHKLAEELSSEETEHHESSERSRSKRKKDTKRNKRSATDKCPHKTTVATVADPLPVSERHLQRNSGPAGKLRMTSEEVGTYLRRMWTKALAIKRRNASLLQKGASHQIQRPPRKEGAGSQS